MSLPYIASADPNSIISVGWSAGGAFSHMLHLIHSNTFKGIANIQGPAYGSKYYRDVVSIKTADQISSAAISALDRYEDSGDIDPLFPGDASATPVYLSTGTKDKIVPTKNQEAVKAIYEHYGVNVWFDSLDIGHYVMAGQPVKAVKWLHEQLGQVASSDEWNADGDVNSLGSLQSFDVTDLIPSDWTMEDSDFATTGLLYVPNDCMDESAGCKIVFALHGCFGKAENIKNSWGLNRFAATNKLIIVYPQSTCWNAYGYLDSEHYLTQKGLYPRVFMNMIGRLTDPFYGDTEAATVNGLLKKSAESRAQSSSLAEEATATLSSIATEKLNFDQQFATATEQKSVADDAFSRTEQKVARAVQYNSGDLVDPNALLTLRDEAQSVYMEGFYALEAINAAKESGVESLNAIQTSAAKLAYPQEFCETMLSTARGVVKVLANEFPSEQAAAATAQTDLDATIASCDTLLQYGTSAEIVAAAGSGIQALEDISNNANPTSGQSNSDFKWLGFLGLFCPCQ